MQLTFSIHPSSADYALEKKDPLRVMVRIELAFLPQKKKKELAEGEKNHERLQ